MSASVPESPLPVCNDFIVRDTENAIVISDIEIPDHDSWMMRAALLVGQRFNIKHIIFAGDTVAFDQLGLSTHPVSFISGEEEPFDVVINMTRDLLKGYGEWFDTIDMITGNHDERPAKATQGQIQLHSFFKDLPVEFSPYSYMYLKFPSTGEYTYIAHQYNYSKNSVNLAQQIWMVESAPDGSKRKMHIVIGHTHVDQMGWSPDNNYRCIGLGCMRLTCILGFVQRCFQGRLFGLQTALLEPLSHRIGHRGRSRHRRPGRLCLVRGVWIWTSGNS